MKTFKTLTMAVIIGAALSGCGGKSTVKPEPVNTTPSTWNTDASKYSTTNTTVDGNNLIATDNTTGASITLSFSTLPTAQGDYTVTAPGFLGQGKVTVKVLPTNEISIENGGTVFVFVKDGKLQANFSAIELGYVSSISFSNPPVNTYKVTNHVTGFLYQK